MTKSGICWKAVKPYETGFSLIRNQQVEGSNPPAGSKDFIGLANQAASLIFTGTTLGIVCQTGNLLTVF
jgi:hypothetical protein